MHFKLYLLAAFFVAASCHDDLYTVKYDTENFSTELAKKNHFVMFYAPWCGHCQRLSPTWDQLAEMLNEDDSNIRIAKVDCTTDSSICSEHDVTGYPTLKFFKVGSTSGEKFRGTRDLPTLSSFINEQLRKTDEESGELKTPPASSLVELTHDNFENLLSTGRHFVKFYAPWCGHCQKLAPVWDQLANSFASNADVSVAKVDCTEFRSICNQYEVKGYPTLLWIEDGKKLDKYQGERSHDDLAAYVNLKRDFNGAAANDAPKTVQGEDQAVAELTSENFSDSIAKGITFVKFFAPWCGHCKRLAPTWEDLAKKFVSNKNVKIIKVDCTNEKSKNLCNEQEVQGFPTVFLYKNGEKISEYNGNRSMEDLLAFIKQHVTSHDEL